MASKFPRTVAPIQDKFYVYALFKPEDFNPFYIGKGKGDRINSHFKASCLKINNRKTAIIKKYGDKIRREILCYFDKEQDAYDFEEYLISLYGLITEGGCLTNYAKTRFEFSDAFVKEVSSTGAKHRKDRLSDEKLSEIFKLFYFDKVSIKDISSKIKIGECSIGNILAGRTYKDNFSNFCKSNNFNHEELLKIRKELIDKNVSKVKSTIDADLAKKLFEDVCNFKIKLSDAASMLGVSDKTLSDIFCGGSNKYLELDYERYKRLYPNKLKSHKEIVQEVLAVVESGESPHILWQSGKYGKTTIYRILKELNSER